MTELHKLRIDKSQKARRDTSSKWPWILLLLLAAGGGVAYWQYQKGASIPTVTVLPVRLTEASATQNDLVLLSANGYIIAAHKIELASKVIGRVAWIGVEMGDKVKKGDIIVRLEDDEYKARVMTMQGQLDAAKARLAELEAGSRPEEVAQMQAQLDAAVAEADNAKLAYNRVLSVRDMEKPAEVDDALALMKTKGAQAEAIRQQLQLSKEGPRKEEIDAQKAVVEQLTGTLSNATIDLDDTIIRAPVTGTVLERNVEVGEFVTNGFVGDRGAKGYVVSLADLNDLLVELDISQDNFAKVIPDGPCTVKTTAYPDHPYKGQVERISPLANRQKATVLVRVRVLNPDDLLRPDMDATVEFLSPASSQTATQTSAAPARPVIRVPAAAVHNNTVFIAENGIAKKIPVTTGLSTAKNEIEITSGLIGGESLIPDPPESLKDGDPVKIKGQP